MSSLTDSELIANLLGRDANEHPSKFEEHQWVYLPDINQGSYSGPIKFNTNRWIDDYMCHPKDYMQIPLEAYGSGTVGDFGNAASAYLTLNANSHITAQNPQNVHVTIKNGAYSLVNTVNLKLNGYTLQNADNLHLSNHTKALTKWSRDYAVSNGLVHLYSKDTSAVNTLAAGATYNSGFYDRYGLTNYNVSFSFPNGGTTDLLASAAANAALPVTVSVQFTAIIHLSIVSDFFDQLGMPLKNANFDIMVGLNGLDKASGPGQNWDMLAIDEKMVAALAHGSLKMKLRIQLGQVCKLFSPRVELSPQDSLELAAQLEEGERSGQPVQKEIFWDDAQVIKNTALPTASVLNMTIAPTIRRPTKVWSMFFPLDGANSQLTYQNVAYPQVTAQGIRDPADVFGVGFTNANLRVDSKKLYEENLNDPFEFYQLVRDQTLAGSDDKQIGSQLSLKDFQSLYQYYCFDLTRTAYRITDKGVALELIATKAGNVATPTELYHVIMLDTVTVLTLMSGDVKVTNISAE